MKLNTPGSVTAAAAAVAFLDVEGSPALDEDAPSMLDEDVPSMPDEDVDGLCIKSGLISSFELEDSDRRVSCTVVMREGEEEERVTLQLDDEDDGGRKVARGDDRGGFEEVEEEEEGGEEVVGGADEIGRSLRFLIFSFTGPPEVDCLGVVVGVFGGPEAAADSDGDDSVAFCSVLNEGPAGETTGEEEFAAIFFVGEEMGEGGEDV